MKRHRICRIAFVVFFSLYALSPLTYDLAAKSMSIDLSRGMSERALRNASLYLIEALYEAFSGANESEDKSLPNRVLIKKKRAVLRGRFVLFPTSDRIAVFAAVDLTARHTIPIESEQADVARARLGEISGCLFLSSGLSPPILS